jgi:hypothetical protein
LAIDPVPPPRPDCPLLDDPLGSRVLEMLTAAGGLTSAGLKLATIGKHLRLDDGTRVIVARNQAECETLTCHARSSRGCSLIEPEGGPGPAALIVGQATAEARQQAARLVVQMARQPQEAP